MGQGEGGETAERKYDCIFFTQRVSGRRHQAMLPMTPSDRWLFLSQVMNHVSAVCPRSRRDETDFGMNLCACQLFARGNNQSPLSAPGLGGFNSLSSTFSLFTCYTSTAGGCLPPPAVAIMLLEVTFFIGIYSTLKKIVYTLQTWTPILY